VSGIAKAADALAERVLRDARFDFAMLPDRKPSGHHALELTLAQ
jgi:hypothetical protein